MEPQVVEYKTYIEALKLVSRPNFSVDVQYHNTNDKPAYAVVDSKETSFWFEAFDSRASAIEFCANMNWNINNLCTDVSQVIQDLTSGLTDEEE